MSKSGHTYPVAQKTSRLTLVVPSVKRQYIENGIRYYETSDGRIFDADIYDSKLVPQKMKILPKHIPVGARDPREVRSLRMVALDKRTPKPEVIEKKCSTCDRTKPGDKFHKAPNSRDGLRNECKECANERTRTNARKKEEAERF